MQIKKVSGFINLMVTNRGNYYHTLDELNEMYRADTDEGGVYDPLDLSNMIFNYMLGFAIDSDRYHNCSMVIRTSRSLSMDNLQEVAELLDGVPLKEHPTNNFIHWTMADFILAYQLDLHALLAAGDVSPAFNPNGPTRVIDLPDWEFNKLD